jgi:hypothetical protein
MAEEKTEFNAEEWHKRMAVECFNSTWGLLDKADRTVEEDDEMLHTAHASRFHWGKIGKPIHFERGEWQISRVNAVLNKPKAALYHAERCLKICRDNGIADFDIAFAYEAMARAYAAAGDTANAKKYIALAKEAGDKIAGEDDKKMFFSDLETVPGYS